MSIRLRFFAAVTPFAAFSLLLLSGCPLPPPEGLDDYVEYEIAKTHIPGLAAAVFTTDSVTWANGYGSANIEEGLAVTPETLFQLASISKTVVAVAAMQLAEDGLLNLDADIGDYLPFAIVHPEFPNVPITIRTLLTHTSGLRDNIAVYNGLYEYGADSPITLSELIEGFYVPGGVWYDADRNFTRHAPGTHFKYSNLGFALIGLLVQTIAAQPFDAYCNQNIFVPLGMTETSWFLRDLDPTHIAMPYRDVSVLGNVAYQPYGQYGYPDYPSGQIRTSVLQFARFYQAIMGGGTLDSAAILQPHTVEAMLTVQFPEINPQQCLGWVRYDGEEGTRIGHGGGEQGVLTMAWFDPDAGTGVLVFTSGDAADLLQNRVSRRVDAMTAIQERLFRDADTL